MDMRRPFNPEAKETAVVGLRSIGFETCVAAMKTPLGLTGSGVVETYEPGRLLEV
jgi:hypothetical protein